MNIWGSSQSFHGCTCSCLKKKTKKTIHKFTLPIKKRPFNMFSANFFYWIRREISPNEIKMVFIFKKKKKSMIWNYKVINIKRRDSPFCSALYVNINLIGCQSREKKWCGAPMSMSSKCRIHFVWAIFYCVYDEITKKKKVKMLPSNHWTLLLQLQQQTRNILFRHVIIISFEWPSFFFLF